MLKLNDSCSSPLRFVTDDKIVIGQFYNSRDKQYHLAIYKPFEQPPTKYLCGKHGNFSPSRAEGQQRKGSCCSVCSKELKALTASDSNHSAELGFE
jgi:hypothetical protein